MLRRLLLALGLLALLVAVVCLLQGRTDAALWLAINGAVLTLGVLFERWRYRQTETGSEPRFVATGERFVDPESGALIEVRYDAASGERRYVRIADSA